MNIDLNNKKSRKFLKLVENTKNDIVQNSSYDKDIVDNLITIYKEKTLSLIGVSGLYQIIEIRKQNIDYIRQIQDNYSFNLVNEEHKYMENFIKKYFEWKVYDYTKKDNNSCYILSSISFKIDT